MKRATISVLSCAVALSAFAAAPSLRSRLLGGRAGDARPDSAARPAAAAQQPAVTDDEATPQPTGSHALNWDGAASDIIIMAYGDEVGKTILKDPACPSATITLKSKQGQKLSREEYLEAIETVLEMNGIHLEPYKDSFIRALPRKDVRKEGIPILMDHETKLGESGKVVSMMIPFANMTAEDAQKVLEGFKSNAGLLIVFERTNKILVTDTEQNINRMLEIARAIDVAAPVTEQVFVRQIKHAAVDDVQKALQAIVDDAMKWQEKNKAPTNPSAQQQPFNRPMLRRGLLGRNRAEPQPVAQPVNNESIFMNVSDADRGMIRGKVLIVPDERSNKLIIITSKANMDFFDKVIEQLDVETTPDTVVKVYRLKYADAEDVSDMINDLIGNSSSSQNKTKNTNPNAKQGAGGNITRSNAPASAAKKPANQRTGEAKAGELSKENTTVLADKRINGLVVMTNKELVPTIESIIESMDIKLSQVLIETMILQVQLSDELTTGIDWVTGLANNSPKNDVIQGLSGGGGTASIGNVGKLNFNSADQLISPGAAGASYFIASKVLNIGAVMHAAKSDSRAKLVASPIIMTLDNKEATIEATKMRYLLKGYTYSGSTYNGSAVPDYEQKEIGLTAKITPKINPNGTVMLTIEEEFSALGDSQTIQAATGGTSNNQQVVSGISVETTVTRKLSADITVENRQTVVLGGLSQTEYSTADSGIPILKDIPYIGRYLFGSTKDVETRQELLMFLTPYVLDDAESAVAEARRRKLTLSDEKPWDDHGWSASPLADPVSLKEQLKRKQREWLSQDKEYEARLELEKKNEKRVEELKERAEKQTALRAVEARQLADEINEAEERKAEARVATEVKARETNAALLEQLREESDISAEAEMKKAEAPEKAKGE